MTRCRYICNMGEQSLETSQCAGNCPTVQPYHQLQACCLTAARSRAVGEAQQSADRIAELMPRLSSLPDDNSASCSPLVNRADTWLRKTGTRINADGSLAIVTPYFNPAGYPTLATNFQAFLKLLGSVPLYPVEVSFGRPWISNGLRILGSERNVLWQKERLINLAVASLPARYDRVAWLDGDIVLTNPDWYYAAERALDEYPVAQIGDTIIVEGKRHNMAAARGFSQWGKLGYAWAARRELFPLYDAAVIGGGDMLCAHGWLGRKVDHLTLSPQWLKHYDTWARKAHRIVQGRIGYVPGTLVHLDHGSHAARQYNERYRLLAGLDPRIDLQTEASGLWAWTETRAAKRFRAAMNGFFASRQDG